MNATEATVIIAAILALVAVIAFLRFNQKAKVSLGVGKAKLNVDASNDPAPAIRAEGLKSRKGGLVAEDATGRGAEVKQVEVKTDIRISTNSHSPKA